MDVTKNINGTYDIVLPDGSGYTKADTFTIKLITDKSYVGDIYDKDGKCIARDRRFFFEKSITDQLNEGEKGLVHGTSPNDEWDLKEIRIWIDNKQVDESVSDPYYYTDGDTKLQLLSKIAEVEEEKINE